MARQHPQTPAPFLQEDLFHFLPLTLGFLTIIREAHKSGSLSRRPSVPADCGSAGLAAQRVTPAAWHMPQQHHLSACAAAALGRESERALWFCGVLMLRGVGDASRSTLQLEKSIETRCTFPSPRARVRSQSWIKEMRMQIRLILRSGENKPPRSQACLLCCFLHCSPCVFNFKYNILVGACK